MVSKTTFTCNTCQKSFAHKSNLTRHMIVHQRPNHLITKPMKKSKQVTKDHICEVCYKGFPSKFKLVRHSYSHLKVKPFPCDVCEKRFSRKDHLQVHYRIHTGEKTCYCMECGEGFNTTTSMQRHMVRLHSIDRKVVACPECGIEFGFKSQLKRHYDYVHRESYVCEFCGNISNSDGALYRHMRKHVLTQPYMCLMCNTQFTLVQSMRDHMCCPIEKLLPDVIVRVALNSMSDYEEEIDPMDQAYTQKIERKFDRRGRKLKHYSNEEEMNMTESGLIDYFRHEMESGGSDDDQETFMEEMQETDETHVCRFCDKPFKTLASKVAHEAVHLNDAKKYSCSICRAKFSDNSKLIRHLRIHTGEMPFMCKFCKQAFHRKDLLQRHMISKHTTDDETCPICFELCTSAEALHAHMQEHSDPDIEANCFFCEFCNSPFEFISELQLHVSNVHPERNYKSAYRSNVLPQVKSSADNNVLLIDELEEEISLKGQTESAQCNGDQSTSLLEELNESLVDESMETTGQRQKTEEQKYAMIRQSKSSHECKECSASFDNLHDFFIHVKAHSEGKNEAGPFNCVLCDEKFNEMEELNSHFQNHEDSMIVEVGVHDKDSDGKESLN